MVIYIDYSFQLPKYVRTTSRGCWSQKQLLNSLDVIKNEAMPVYKAALNFGISRKTSERRLQKNNAQKLRTGDNFVSGFKKNITTSNT